MIDLHLHSTYSDGTFSVQKILEEAEKLGLKYISITDHDTCLAYEELKSMDVSDYYKKGTVIPGIEIKCGYKGRTIEVLGYKIDTDKMQKWMDEFYKDKSKADLQRKYFDQLYDATQRVGLKMPPKEEHEWNPENDWASFEIYKDIKKYEENKEKMPEDFWEDFTVFSKKYCADLNSPFYINKTLDYPSLEQAIGAIKECGGVAMVAHVFIYKWADDKIKMINDMASNYDIDGFECYHSNFSESEINYIVNYCEKNNLLMSGGSDCHGANKPKIKLGVGKGNLSISEKIIENWIDKKQEITMDKKLEKILDRVRKNINAQKTIKKEDVNYLLENQEKFDEIQKQNFSVMLEQINELIEPETNKALIYKKENPFLKLPGIKQIYGLIQSRILAQNKNNIDEMLKQEHNDEKSINPIDAYRYEIPRETIVISDLHGRIDKWDFVKQKISKDPYLDIVILGDAMDRGEFGPEILLEIKELSDKGRAKYLPGNHDVFAYNYLQGVNNPYYGEGKGLLLRNGGAATIEKFENFDKVVKKQLEDGRISKSIKLNELVEWLGKQPIQDYITENGINYALSHAVFDAKLYNQDKNFSLEKALQTRIREGSDSETMKRFNNCMWYRDGEKNTQYAELSWPNDAVVVAGHTRQKNVNLQTVDGDFSKPIIYIDCGKGELQGYSLTQRKQIDLEKQPTSKQDYSR